MPFKLPDGRTISEDTPFTYNGIQYPSNWLRLSTPEEKQAIGLQEVAPEQPYDQRFFWGYDQDGNLIPKDHSQLVEQWVSQTKQTAGTLLAPTDWMIVRQAETGVEVPENILTYRTNIREESTLKELEIESTSTTEELAAYITGPDYPVWTSQS